MVSIEEKIRAEMENITTVLTEIERVKGYAAGGTCGSCGDR
jgi:bacterioferritin-associated ferredoxin